MQAIMEPTATTNLWLLVIAVGRLACEDAVPELEQSCPEFSPQMRGFPTMLQENHEHKNLKSKTLY